jgi:hypothetical protein
MSSAVIRVRPPGAGVAVPVAVAGTVGTGAARLAVGDSDVEVMFGKYSEVRESVPTVSCTVLGGRCIGCGGADMKFVGERGGGRLRAGPIH